MNLSSLLCDLLFLNHCFGECTIDNFYHIRVGVNKALCFVFVHAHNRAREFSNPKTLILKIIGNPVGTYRDYEP